MIRKLLQFIDRALLGLYRADLERSHVAWRRIINDQLKRK